MNIPKHLSVLLFFICVMPYSIANAIDIASMQMPEIRSVKILSLSIEKGNAVLEVDAYNPNEYKIPVREVSGQILLNQVEVSNFEANSKKSIAAKSTQTFTVPIHINADATLQSANTVMLTGIADYEFKGFAMTPVGEVPLAKTGRLTSDQILTFLKMALFAR